MSRLSFKKANARRCALIEKEIMGGGLSLQESAELERLTQFVDDWIDKRYPLPYAPLRGIEAFLGSREDDGA